MVIRDRDPGTWHASQWRRDLLEISSGPEASSPKAGDSAAARPDSLIYICICNRLDKFAQFEFEFPVFAGARNDNDDDRLNEFDHRYSRSAALTGFFII